LTRDKEGKADTLKDGALHVHVPVVASNKGNHRAVLDDRQRWMR